MNNKWILTSEREPEKEGDYIIKTRYGEVVVMHYYNGWNKHNDDNDKYEIDSSYIKAWMPFSALALLDLSSVEYHEIKALFSALIKSPKQEVEEDRLGWIPVSERLPEEDGSYLVTEDDGYVRIAPFEVANGFGWWDEKSNDFEIVWVEIPVVAWMPLPKHYEEVKKND